MRTQYCPCDLSFTQFSVLALRISFLFCASLVTCARCVAGIVNDFHDATLFRISAAGTFRVDLLRHPLVSALSSVDACLGANAASANMQVVRGAAS